MKEDTRLGIDTGGTFTDFVLYRQGELTTYKLPSTPHNPAEAILTGIKALGLDPAHLILIHGTTVGTNALLERKGGRIALITTHGFEDIIFIGRQTRKKLYSLVPEERKPLLPSSFCFGVRERVLAGGRVEKSLAKKEIPPLIKRLKENKIEAVAICFLHAYINPVHEQLVARALRKAGFLVSVSHELLPEYREYERMALTTLNAYLMPVMERYLAHLEKNLAGAKIWIMQSNEGFISPQTVRREPIRTALSGPAAGVVAADQLGRMLGVSQIITFDMGGTSTDVSLIDGRISRTAETVIGDFPVRIPMIDIHTIGSGGGSIAYLDQGQALRVGPQSAGANPGPACYGRSLLPTVTDANLICGRLDPEYFLGGRLKIYPEKSLESVAEIARRINKSIHETAEGIIQVANANMEKAIRVISIERGYDLRKFTLLSFGGAGGMHAAEIAADLNISRVIIPNHAGVFSALGLLLADAVKDFSLSFLTRLEDIHPDRLAAQFQQLKERAIQEMQREGFGPTEIKVFPSLDMRYYGQSYEIELPYSSSIDLAQAFHQEHQRLYSYHHPDQPVEIVNLKIKVVGTFPRIKLSPCSSGDKQLEPAFVRQQRLYYRGEFQEAPVYRQAKLNPGAVISGPALISARESTTFVPPGYQASVDKYLNLILERNGSC
jgi:N-methylhydantoinase A/oxoprolinase/acetone carboxylase beta subunit